MRYLGAVNEKRALAALRNPRISINHLPECYIVTHISARMEECDCGRDEFRAEVARLTGDDA